MKEAIGGKIILSKVTIAKLVNELVQQGLSEQVAWWLLEKLFNKTKVELILLSEFNLSAQEQVQLTKWTRQIVQEHKPVQYILGEVNFWGLKILVEPPILIPRPETEEWCAVVIKQLNNHTAQVGLKILDLCAGTGCIGLALAHAIPSVQVWAVDINPQACELIEKNKLLNKINNLTVINFDLNKVNFNKNSNNSRESINSDFFKLGAFDVIVANPPYITELEYSELAPNIRDWEDPNALISGTDGLSLIRKIINLAVQIKIKVLYLEIGYLQAQAVTMLARSAGFKQIVVHRDMYNKDRMLEMHLI